MSDKEFDSGETIRGYLKSSVCQFQAITGVWKNQFDKKDAKDNFEVKIFGSKISISTKISARSDPQLWSFFYSKLNISGHFTWLQYCSFPEGAPSNHFWLGKNSKKKIKWINFKVIQIKSLNWTKWTWMDMETEGLLGTKMLFSDKIQIVKNWISFSWVQQLRITRLTLIGCLLATVHKK